MTQKEKIAIFFQDTNYCCLLPNVVNKFGWIPGDKALALFRRIAQEYTGDPDITFEQVQLDDVHCTKLENIEIPEKYIPILYTL